MFVPADFGDALTPSLANRRTASATRRPTLWGPSVAAATHDVRLHSSRAKAREILQENVSF